MKVIKIEKTKWAEGLQKAGKSFRLIGPKKVKDKKFGEFRELADAELPDMELADTRLSPKCITFPESEVMFTFTTDPAAEDANILKRPQTNATPRAVVGIRPYDAAAFKILKKNFDTPDYRDPYWCDAYEASTFIGLAVTDPDLFDFSTSVGTGPFDESALDVLLVDEGDHYLAKQITDKGGAWVEAAGWKTDAGDSAEERIEEKKAEAEGKVDSKIVYDGIGKKSIMDLYEADFWKDAAFACINCGTCTYVCPTCWCFDIQDETKGADGKRCKNWDSCMYPLFTHHASGHNPRGEKYMRVRQRFMHKLKYFLDKYEDGVMCVGCGRCIRSCPVNIDIRGICEKMNQYDPEKSCAC